MTPSPSPDSRSGEVTLTRADLVLRRKLHDLLDANDLRGADDLLARTRIAAERAALELAAQYVSQHDNLGDIAADEIRALLPAGESQHRDQVGCIRPDGKLNVHYENETCKLCAGESQEPQR